MVLPGYNTIWYRHCTTPLWYTMIQTLYYPTMIHYEIDTIWLHYDTPWYRHRTTPIWYTMIHSDIVLLHYDTLWYSMKHTLYFHYDTLWYIHCTTPHDTLWNRHCTTTTMTLHDKHCTTPLWYTTIQILYYSTMIHYDKCLHLLKIEQRIQYKVASVTYKVL